MNDKNHLHHVGHGQEFGFHSKFNGESLRVEAGGWHYPNYILRMSVLLQYAHGLDENDWQRKQKEVTIQR